MELEQQRIYNRKYRKAIDPYDEKYWNEILKKRHDPIPPHIQAKLDRDRQEREAQAKKKEDDFDVSEAYMKLRAEVDKAETEDPICWEDFYKESEEHRRAIPMYDFGLGQMSNEQDMIDFYGGGLVRKIRQDIEKSYDMPNRERKTGQISKKLWQELKDVRAGRKPPQRLKMPRRKDSNGSETKTDTAESEFPNTKPPKTQAKSVEVTQRQRQPGDDYFLTTERGIVRNESYREVFKGPGILYEWIWANVVRSQWIDTNGYPIKEKYYDRGYLAYCSSYRQLARDCGLHKNKVKEYIDAFSEAGVIKVEHLVPNGKKRGQSVFIIGTWRKRKDANGKPTVIEHYFRDDIFLTRKNGQNVPV